MSLVYAPLDADTTVATVAHNDGIRLDIRNNTGIGGVIAWLSGSQSAGDVTLRLYLNGLEQLSLEYGDAAIRASVSSHGDPDVRQYVSISGADMHQIAPDSPYWLEITSGELDGGLATYFDIRLPNSLLADDAQAIKLEWVDFYR